MDELELTEINLGKICRICLTECRNMFSIYSELLEENSAESISRLDEILKKISSIKVFTVIQNTNKMFLNLY